MRLQDQLNKLCPNLVQSYKKVWEGNEKELDKLGSITTVQVQNYVSIGGDRGLNIRRNIRMTGHSFGTNLSIDEAEVLVDMLNVAVKSIPQLEQKQKELTKLNNEVKQKKLAALAKLSDEEKILLGLQNKAKNATSYLILTKEIKDFFYNNGYDIKFRNRGGKHYITLETNYKYAKLFQSSSWYNHACNLVSKHFPACRNTSASENELTFRIN